LTWSEHPFFVPFGEDNLSTVVTLPSDPPQGLAILLQGLGAPRSHRYSLWTRIARTVANRGLASVRFDYRGMGDSTGTCAADLNQPPSAEALVVVKRTAEMLDTPRVAAVGNCMGARTALTVALGLESCAGIGFVLQDSLHAVVQSPRPSQWTRVRSRLAAKAPTLLRRARRSLREQSSRPRFLPEVGVAASTMNTLFLFIGPDRVGRMLERGIVGLGSPARRPVFHSVRAGVTPEFQLTLEAQDEVISGVSSWLVNVLIQDRAGPPDPMPHSPLRGL